MRSSDSRTLRWTVHLTAREYELLELLRADWGSLHPLSRAAMLMLLVEQAVSTDDPVTPRVSAAWLQVQRELNFTNDHSGRGGRDAKVSLPGPATARR
jgi:hypothetical protein